MSSPSDSINCRRCRQPVDPDAVQCDNCGELLTGKTLRDRTVTKTQRLFEVQRSAVESAGGSVGRVPAAKVPVRAIARYTALAAVSLLILSALCVGAAWLADAMALQLMRASSWLALAAGAAILAGIATALLWGLVNTIERWLLKLEIKHAERDRQKRAEQVAKYEAEELRRKENLLPPKQRPQQWDPATAPPRPKPPRPVPGQLTLVFAVLGIFFGLIALALSVIPFFGLFTYAPLVSAAMFTLVAWVLSFYERSQKLLPAISTIIMILAAMGMVAQFIIIGAAAKAVMAEETKQMDELSRIQKEHLKQMDDQLEASMQKSTDMTNRHVQQNIETLGKIFRSLPTPPPPPSKP